MMNRLNSPVNVVTCRLLPAVALLLLLASALAQTGASFASLVITPAGNEEYDISTGITTLTGGGIIHDQESGITLEAPFISYRVDDFIETGSAVVTGDFGTVSAETVHVDISESLLTAAGELQLTGRNLQAAGEELSYHAEEGVVDLRGNVQATDPAFSASRILYDTGRGTVLLFGPYTYDDGFLTLSASSSDSHLELRRPEPEPEDSDEFSFLVSSTPDPATLALFSAWLD